jgi:hypothetical protein
MVLVIYILDVLWFETVFDRQSSPFGVLRMLVHELCISSRRERYVPPLRRSGGGRGWSFVKTGHCRRPAWLDRTHGAKSGCGQDFCASMRTALVTCMHSAYHTSPIDRQIQAASKNRPVIPRTRKQSRTQTDRERGSRTTSPRRARLLDQTLYFTRPVCFFH